MIWDRGTWDPEGDPHKGLTKGHLSFTLDGEKLKGAWHLVRIRGRPGEKKANWLLIKAHDEAARSEGDPDILEEKPPNSVVTGRSIPEIAEGKGRKRVWHSNRGVKENVKAGATRGVAAAARPAKTARARGARAREKMSKAKQVEVEEQIEGEGAAKAPRCPGSSRPRLRRYAPPLPPAPAGCTRSSSTAIASRRGSITARCACSRARVSTGPPSFPTWRQRSRRCRPTPR